MKRVMKTDDELLIRSMGKSIRVTAIFTDLNEANTYMENHRDEGCIAEFAPFIFIANLYDNGQKRG